MRFFNLLFLMLPFVTLAQIPNCVPIRGDYLWMSITEVSNEFYTHFLQGVSDEYSIKNLPKSEMWVKSMKYGDPLKEQYFQHPAYKKYPVVNVTYEQVTNYCNWVTERLNVLYPYQKVLVRLPTEKEWEEAAKAGNKYANYPWGTESMRVEKGKYKGNFQANFVLRKGISMMDGATITAPVTSYWPNDFGLYNMSGNVAEMTSEKGLVKGGSWRNRADWLRIDKQQYVYSASPEVGFRYVVEIIELPQPKKSPKALKLNKKFFKKYFAEINDTLLIGKYEVTNELFDFLPTLGTPHCYKLPGISKTDSNWLNLFPHSQLWMHNYSSHSNFYHHPVVNVTQEDAQNFCSWLETVYENEFNKKVEFRLPTEKEWEFAAKGKSKNSPYPWGGPYIRNSKGCFLANHNPKMSESENVNGHDTLSLHNFFQTHFTDLDDFDGEAVLAPVDSYFPNNYGIYNMAGNAAEMILDSNFTKGGSWKSKAYYLQIDNKEEWNRKANPFTGFRVVMIRKNP